MKITEKGTNMKITEEIRDYLYKKINYLEKFIDSKDQSVICRVELGKSTKHHKNGEIFRTEINLHIAGKDLNTVTEAENLFSSIDEAKEEMTSELKSFKDKRLTMMKRGGTKVKKIVKEISKKK